MKRISIIAVALALGGCTLWDAYFMTKYDPNEYLLITQIRTDAGQYKRQCENHLMASRNAVDIANKTDLFEKYSEKIPSNENGIRASKSLNEIAQGLANNYLDANKGNPSATFCKLKYNSIENSAAVIQHVVGNKPR